MNRFRALTTTQATGLLSQQVAPQQTSGLAKNVSTQRKYEEKKDGSNSRSRVAAGSVAAVAAAALALKIHEEKDK